MDAVVGRAVTAGRVVPRQCRCRRGAAVPQPDFKRVEESAVGIVRIDRDTLVVPILVVIALLCLAILQ